MPSFACQDPLRRCNASARLQTLIEFYPKHIAKEDEVFFPAVRAYFTADEEQAMLAEFREFDRKMIHERTKPWWRGWKAGRRHRITQKPISVTRFARNAHGNSIW